MIVQVQFCCTLKSETDQRQWSKSLMKELYPVGWREVMSDGKKYWSVIATLFKSSAHYVFVGLSTLKVRM